MLDLSLHTDIAVAWEALFVYDLMIFSLTLYRSYKERLEYGVPMHTDLFSLIIRDGKGPCLSMYRFLRYRQIDRCDIFRVCKFRLTLVGHARS